MLRARIRISTVGSGSHAGSVPGIRTTWKCTAPNPVEPAPMMILRLFLVRICTLPVSSSKISCRKYMTLCPMICFLLFTEPEAQLPECEDNHVHCKAWSDRGECSINPKYMLKTCPKSCKICAPNLARNKQDGKKAKRSLLSSKEL
jgi:hypothetical protein